MKGNTGHTICHETQKYRQDKASNDWYDSHEYYDHVTNDFMSMKVRINNHLRSGEISKYKKETSSTTMVLAATSHPIKYINAIFSWVDTITKRRLKQEA